MRAADCREVSTPAGVPPTLSESPDQCQHAVEMGERQEGEVAAEVGDDPAVTVSFDSNEETGNIEDIVSDKLGPLNKQDEMSDAQGSVMSVKTDEDEKTADVEQSEYGAEFSTKYLDEQTEHDDKDEVNKVRQNINEDLGDAQDVAEDCGIKPVSGVDKVDKEECPGFNKDKVEGRRESKPSKTLHVYITEEEIRPSPSGDKRSTETKSIKIETFQGKTSLVGYNERNVKRKLDPKTAATLSNSLCDLNLSKSPSPKRQKKKSRWSSVKEALRGKRRKQTEQRCQTVHSRKKKKKDKKQTKKVNKQPLTCCFK